MPESLRAESVPAESLPDEAYRVALASLDIAPNRLRALVSEHGARNSWRRICDGLDAVGAIAHRHASLLDVGAFWRRHHASGIGVSAFASASYPAALTADIEPPVVLFHRGDLDVLSGPRVAIVGTRRCTQYGRDVAAELGERLSAAGVAVVSGLALGIDAAAHLGARRAGTPPVGVVACGLDIVYPRRNRGLWADVAQHGVLLSEVALGVAPQAWRFPARNRIIAALADVIVVVESHDKGGSLSTVAAAMQRDRTVLAVPGPVTSPASAGTNRLLADGCAPACGIDDVLVALGLSPGRSRQSRERRVPPDAGGRAVLDALGWQPSTLEQLALRTGLALGPLAVALEALQRDRWVARRGGWYERVGREQAAPRA